MSSGKKFGWAEFLTGFAAGSLVSLILSRRDLKDDIENVQRKAEEIKHRLISGAKNISAEITERSRNFIESSRKFAEGKYSGTLETLEKEYNSIRYAISTAIDNYRRNQENLYPRQKNGDDLYIDFDDETLPKFAGMGRRKR